MFVVSTPYSIGVIFLWSAGETVMTKYNNRTYRIDDVDETANPNSSFTLADGRSMTFVEYYRQHYNLEIRDHRQWMLVHRPRRQTNPLHVRPNGDKLILLVPELCFLTGLTDTQRADNRLINENVLKA